MHPGDNARTVTSSLSVDRVCYISLWARSVCVCLCVWSSNISADQADLRVSTWLLLGSRVCDVGFVWTTAAVLNRRLPASCLWPPNCYSFTIVFRFGQHVYTGTCLHANDTQTAGSLSAMSTTFNFSFHFWSSLRIHILPVVRENCVFQVNCWDKVGSENPQLKFAFILPPTRIYLTSKL